MTFSTDERILCAPTGSVNSRPALATFDDYELEEAMKVALADINRLIGCAFTIETDDDDEDAQVAA